MDERLRENLAFIIFLLMPAVGLLLSLRIWLFLRNGLRVTARIVGYKRRAFERWYRHGELPVQDDEVKLIYRRGDPQHPKIAHWSLLWLGPIFLLGPAIILLIALGWMILVSKLSG